MKPRLFTILSALSLLLFVAVCVLWVRSRTIWDERESFLSERSGNEVRVNGRLIGIRRNGTLVFGRTAYVFMFRSEKDARRCTDDLGPDRSSWRRHKVGAVSMTAGVLPEQWLHRRSQTPPIVTKLPLSGRLGFGGERYAVDISPGPFRTSPGPPGYITGGSATVSWIAVPCWPLLALTAPLPVLWVATRLARLRRSTHGLCPSCGYDLRATPDRCPECGAIARPPAATAEKASGQ